MIAQANFGVKAGMNIGSPEYYGQELKNVVLPHMRAYMQFMLAEKFYLKPQLLYSMKGGDFESELQTYTEFYDLRLNYIDVPILLGYNIYDKLNIEVGPQIGYLLSAKSGWISIEGGSDSREDKIDRFKKTEISLSIGANYNIYRKVSIYLGYQKALSNIHKHNHSGHTKNSVFQFGIEYELR